MDRYYRLRIIAADCSDILNKIWSEGIELLDVKWIDPLTLEAKLSQKQIVRAQDFLEKKCIKHTILGKEGKLWLLSRVWKRPVLLAGTVFFLLVALYAPGRIFFMNVKGNERVPDQYILEAAQNCGIVFGTKRSMVRSEEIKNYLLAQLPELQWVGVTTSGTVATIHVKERSIADKTLQEESGVTGIVATQDGVVSEITILQGTPMVQVGQAVKAGDLLISGYSDCGRFWKAEQAKGEVYAHTVRDVIVVSPKTFGIRGGNYRQHTCYKLRIGKKVINLCNHSGISDTTCVKMYLEDYWTLPGDFRLPIALLKEELVFYDISMVADEQTYAWMSDYTREYLLSHMVAGQILEEMLEWDLLTDHCVLAGNYACHEMIGQVKHEELIEQYAEDN